MGKRLLPATGIRSIIETSFEQGLIKSESMETWKEDVEKMKLTFQARGDAEKGDVDSMELVAFSYYVGSGFLQSKRMAFKWSEAARRAGSVNGMTLSGLILLKGDDIPRSTGLALTYLTNAAFNGSQTASFHLGRSYAAGDDGLPTSKVLAVHWLMSALSIETDHALDELDDDDIAKAKELLEELRKVA